jgi:hypothetical protein
MPYDTSTVNIFVPDVGLEVSGDRIRPGGPFQAQDVTLQTYLADELSAGERLTLRLSGTLETGSTPAGPSPHVAVGPNETQSIVIGLTTLAAALAFAYLYWQGHLSLRRTPLAPPAGAGESSQLEPVAQNRQSAMLQAIADLDDAFEEGQMKEKQYRARRARLKRELIETMEAENS